MLIVFFLYLKHGSILTQTCGINLPLSFIGKRLIASVKKMLS